MDRRNFLQLFSLAPASVAASESLVEPVNLRRVNDRRVDAAIPAKIPSRLYSTVLPHADYDLMQIPEGELVPDSWSFFTQPIGSPTMGTCQWCERSRAVPLYSHRTVLHTSQLRANSFPPPQTRSWDKLVFLFSPRMDEDDRLDLVMNFWFQLRLDDRIYAQGPVVRCPVVGTLDDLVAVEVTGGRPVRKLVPLDAPFAIPFAQPLYVAPLQHFSLTLHGHSFVARKTIEVYAFLDGLAEYPTQ